MGSITVCPVQNFLPPSELLVCYQPHRQAVMLGQKSIYETFLVGTEGVRGEVREDGIRRGEVGPWNSCGGVRNEEYYGSGPSSSHGFRLSRTCYSNEWRGGGGRRLHRGQRLEDQPGRRLAQLVGRGAGGQNL